MHSKDNRMFLNIRKENCYEENNCFNAYMFAGVDTCGM